MRTKLYYLKDTDGEIRYIGRTTKSLKNRFNHHIYECKNIKKNNHKSKWLRKCIRENRLPTIHLIVEVDGNGCDLEQFLITIAKQKCQKLVNACDGGKGSLGHICPKKAKEKLRLINLGKKHTEETKRKISEAGKRNPPSLECIKKANEAVRNKKKSKEHLIKLSQSKGGKPFICLENNKKYDLLSEAQKDLKVTQTKICACLKGRRKSTGGYHFKYINESTNHSRENRGNNSKNK